MNDGRAFDDGRAADLDGRADCFLCGRKVDPLDPQRGSYTANAAACEPLPIHLPCLDDHRGHVMAMFMSAINTMSDANAKRQLARAAVATAEVR